MIMSAELVPFGKYKGQPVEALAADNDYAEWLLSQPWFRDRWPNVYNVVIAYGGEPQDSPEHNQMQARFLDAAWCLALADHLGLRRLHGLGPPRAMVAKDPNIERFRRHIKLTEHDMNADGTEFEVRGWDVVFDLNAAHIDCRITPLPGCICRCQHRDHEKYRSGDEPGKVRIDRAWAHCGDGCVWGDTETGRWLREPPDYLADYGLTVYAELKPDLGDDYPAVLRQVKGYDTGSPSRRAVVARRHAFEHVTWEQVGKMFAASGITLVAEQGIAACLRGGA
jgi:hypothetical protein